MKTPRSIHSYTILLTDHEKTTPSIKRTYKYTQTLIQHSIIGPDQSVTPSSCPSAPQINILHLLQQRPSISPARLRIRWATHTHWDLCRDRWWTRSTSVSRTTSIIRWCVVFICAEITSVGSWETSRCVAVILVRCNRCQWAGIKCWLG